MWVQVPFLGVDLIFFDKHLAIREGKCQLVRRIDLFLTCFFPSRGNFTRTLSAPTIHIKPQHCALEIEQLCVREMAMVQRYENVPFLQPQSKRVSVHCGKFFLQCVFRGGSDRTKDGKEKKTMTGFSVCLLYIFIYRSFVWVESRNSCSYFRPLLFSLITI